MSVAVFTMYTVSHTTHVVGAIEITVCFVAMCRFQFAITRNEMLLIWNVLKQRV